METRRIDDAISLLSRAESWISNRARTNEDYRLAREMRETAKDAGKELASLHSAPKAHRAYMGEEPYHEPTECFCNASNAPCNFCENHCAECSEHLDDCECN